MKSLVLRNVLIVTLLLICATVAHGAFDSATFNENDSPLTITSIKPSGEDVPAERQIVLHFNRPVVPVGRMERAAAEIPITIEPALNCEWRWLNTSSLACQLGDNDALTFATRYSVHVEPGITTEDGTSLSEAYEHSFVTARPVVKRIYFRTWQAPGWPVIQVRFNSEVTRESAQQHLFLKTPDNQRIAVNVSEDADAYSRIRNQVWLIEPAVELPIDTATELWVEPGLKAVVGNEPGIEERVVVAFDTFPEFSYQGIRCWDNDGNRIELGPQANALPDQLCNPLNTAEFLFSTPVLSSELKAGLKIIPDLAGGRDDYDPWEDYHDYSRLRSRHKKGNLYSIRFPEKLQAYQPYTLMAEAGSILDEFGRPLLEEIKQMFFTNHRKPIFRFERTFSVLEKHEQTELPIIVTNLKKIDIFYDKLSITGLERGIKHKVTLPEVQDVSYATPMEVRKALPDSGVMFGRFNTDPVVSTSDNWFFSQVTPFAVSAKIGHFSSVVWVTDMVSGEPVANAVVDIYKADFPGLKADPQVFATKATDADGTVSLPGTFEMDPGLRYLGRYTSPGSTRLFARVRKGDDIALLPLTSNFSAEMYDRTGSYVNNNMQRKYGHIQAWGTTAQGVYRAGDTVQYKLYVRHQDKLRFVSPPLGGYSLKVIDPMGKEVHQVKNLTLNEFGAFDGEFPVSKNGAVGWYQFELNASFASRSWQPMKVLVSDFTPSAFKVSTRINGELFYAGDEMIAETLAQLHGGGPYIDAETRVTVNLKPRSFSSSNPVARKFYFQTSQGNRSSRTIDTTHGVVDDKGELTTKVILNASDVLYGNLYVESAVRDDRGKYIASAASAKYVGRDRFVGLFFKDWLMAKDEPATVEMLVVDEFGDPAAAAEINLDIEYRQTTASRVKGAGNAYLTRFNNSWVDVGAMNFTSGEAPTTYDYIPEKAGLYRFTVTTRDTQGRAHATTFQRWAAGSGAMVWPSDEGHGLQIIPAQTEYKVGETARFLIQNPYPGAKALITIERYGILRKEVTTLADSTAVIEVPIEKDDVPGFYLSVSIVSPRVEKPLGEGQVDLGKPTYKMGYLKVPVVDPAKQLEVTVASDKEVYRPREKVTIDLKALPKSAAAATGQPVEMAVVVLDEAVLDLIQGGESYYDIYRGFYHLESLDVANFNLLMKLLGRQKFEKKGANTGGDGGPDLELRSLIKFVSYWNPSVKADKDGQAQVSFELPDNLTGWRVLVMAVTPDDLLGLGQANFKVNRPTEVRPVLPNQVSEGDQFEAGFSVMNRTKVTRKLKVKITAEGSLAGSVNIIEKQVTVAPYKREIVWLPLVASGSGKITLVAKAWDEIDGDMLKHEFPVKTTVDLQTAATYGTTTQNSVQENILIPEGIRTDAGEISTVVAPTVIGNVTGAFSYLKNYPYICWEQKLTKGVMASHYQQLAAYMDDQFEWPGSKGLPDETLAQAGEHQAPNGGMVYYIPQDQYVSPYLSAYTAIAFNWLRASGYQIPEKEERKLHGYLKNMLRRDVMPTFYSDGMASTVRAVALAALAKHGKINRNDLLRYQPYLKQMDLFGKAHFLQAALQVENTGELRLEAANMILAHANETGGKFIFSEEVDTSYQRILSSTLRTQAAVLDALLQYGETVEGAPLVGSVPFKLVRTITQSRGQKDRWENTQENMFCLNALIEFSRVYEAEKPEMTIKASVNNRSIGSIAFDDFTDSAATFSRPLTERDPGQPAVLNLERNGKGRLYYAARISYALKNFGQQSINSGIEARREYSVERDGKWVVLQTPMQIESGELVRVDLFLSLPAARNFVVVNDPVPGGLEPVNRDLATSSTVDADKGEFSFAGSSFWFSRSDWRSYAYSRWSFYHKELRHDSVRFYSEYLPAGNYHLSYVAQAIASGTFSVLPLHAEEMYDPDVFGKGTAAKLVVERDQ